MSPAVAYLKAARTIIEKIEDTQFENLDATAEICTRSITSSYVMSNQESKRQFDDSYDDYRRRMRKVYGDG